jgi:hypothetical protein
LTVHAQVGTLRDVQSRAAGVLIGTLILAGCGAAENNGVVGSVDLGDDFIAPDLHLDEETFYCRVQPEVLTKSKCATGNSGEGGSCHSSQSALRLIDTDEPAPCNRDGMLDGEPPDAYKSNFVAVQFAVQGDPLNSPLYLRPTGNASHPRVIFNENDPAAVIIYDWISAGAR